MSAGVDDNQLRCVGISCLLRQVLVKQSPNQYVCTNKVPACSMSTNKQVANKWRAFYVQHTLVGPTYSS
jgi:hypothetical protein